MVLQAASIACQVTIVLHPLSGRRDATAFHLEAGRLCVLTSRHQHACIIVACAGIADLLDAHPSDEPIHLGVRAKFPDGWEANHAVLAHLADHRYHDGELAPYLAGERGPGVGQACTGKHFSGRNRCLTGNGTHSWAPAHRAEQEIVASRSARALPVASHRSRAGD